MILGTLWESKIIYDIPYLAISSTKASKTNSKSSQTSIMKIFYESTISFIISSDFLMFYQIFLSPQEKRCAIITYKHGIYELRHELPNDLRHRIFGN